MWDRVTGKRHSDIALPNESGQTDSRFSDPNEILKSLTDNPALQALKQYGLAASKK